MRIIHGLLLDLFRIKVVHSVSAAEVHNSVPVLKECPFVKLISHQSVLSSVNNYSLCYRIKQNQAPVGT